jgi:hypothetical protein
MFAHFSYTYFSNAEFVDLLDKILMRLKKATGSCQQNGNRELSRGIGQNARSVAQSHFSSFHSSNVNMVESH